MPKLRKKSESQKRNEHSNLINKLRADPNRRLEEQSRNSEARKKARLDPDLRLRDQKQMAKVNRNYRLDPIRRKVEQHADTEARKNARTNPDVRLRDQLSNVQSLQTKRRRRIRNSDFGLLLQEFESQIREGPTLICSCCGGLWYKKSVRHVSPGDLRRKGSTDQFLKEVFHVNQEQQVLCVTCYNSVSKGKIPKLSLSNGFDFPLIPHQLKGLTNLEERLVALRLPFCQIRSLGADRQCGLHGNIVNVMNDLDTTAKVLPRSFNESSTVQVMLMRRLCYKAPYIYEVIRPLKVYEAAKYLSQTELYKKEGVILSESWSNVSELDAIDFIMDPKDKEWVDKEQEGQMEIEMDEPSTDRSETIEPETLILSEEERSGLIQRIAPGEGKRPLSLLRDEEAEPLSFPKIYCGQGRKFKPGLVVSYTDIAKSEARRYDRRCCYPAKVLYSYKLLQNKRIAEAIQLCLRKKKGGGAVTAGQLKSEAFVSALVQHDDGYRMLKNIRGSPAYWEMQLKNIMAMLRQLEIPTFFMTFSAAETRWPELLVMLSKLLKEKDLNEEEAMDLTFAEKSDLIRNDPITCARNFDHRLRALLNILLKKPGGIFAQNKLVDYFLRDEFQVRGSPHCHGLYWLDNAPVFKEEDPDSYGKCATFIDGYITCERKESDGMDSVMGYQIHRHSHTCKKYNKDGDWTCRFQFPRPPMRKTIILQPLEKESPEIRKARKDFQAIKSVLTSMGRNFKDDIPFGDFLKGLEMTDDVYTNALRSSIKRPTVFLKRSTNAIFVNAYNEKILKAWRANMDIQFILDPYSCAKYCVSYLTKSEAGVSKLLRKANQECRQGNTTIKERLRKFGNVFTNFVEISAQEAAYGLLGIPLIRSSVTCEYINTSPPEERVFLVKTKAQLENLPDNSTEIAIEGPLNRYTNRPDQLESASLADFTALYDYSKTKKGMSINAEEVYDDADPVPVNEDDTPSNWIQLTTGWLRKRKRPKVIRYRRYNEHQDPENFYREMFMLHVPWRSEDVDILAHSPKDLYSINKSLIEDGRRKYDKNGFSEDVDDYVLEDEEESEAILDPEYKALFDVDTHTDLFQDLGLVDQNKNFDFIKPPKFMPDDEYWSIVRSLNVKQRRYFLHIVHNLKTGRLPFYELLHGAAGVGKSRLIFALVQTVTRMYSKIPGRNLEDVVVLVAAFTGKAACNVFGITLHSAFRLPNSQNTGDIVRLVDDVCNTLRSKLLGLKLIIIDEISMVSVKQLFQIDSRLKQVFQNELPFGGISILAAGHFRQLKPVMASYVFETPKFKTLGHITGNTLWPLFKFFELTEVMRQKGQFEFFTALNNMSEGTMSNEDIALIKSREISNGLTPPEDATRLFYTNVDCHDYNVKYHAKLQTEGAVSTAIDRVQGKASEQQKKKLLEKAAKLKVGDSDGLPYKVHLQVSADFFVSTNVDVSDGLFNGCTGTLMKIDYGHLSSGERIPIRAWMKFKNDFFGAYARTKTNRYQLLEQIDPTWTAIDMDTRVLSRTQRHRHQIVRKQIPLVEANAITIHKSQSSSIDHLVVCVKKKMSRELLYVACSRATSLEGLFLDGEFTPPSPPPPGDPVTLEMDRLRANAVQFSMKFLEQVDDSKLKMIFHNVQSLQKHYEDVKCDLNYMAADIMAFVEPWTLASDNFRFDGFECIDRVDCIASRNSFGSIVFAKSRFTHQLSEFAHSHHLKTNGHHLLTFWKVGEIRCILVYRSPNSSLESFYISLDDLLKKFIQESLIVIGDFNIDLIQKPGQQLIQMMHKFGLLSRLPPRCQTTDGGSQIDCCFSNVAGLEAWIYESVWSYHKPLCVTWPKEKVNSESGELIMEVTESMEIPPSTEEQDSSTSNVTLHLRQLRIDTYLDSLLDSAVQIQTIIDDQYSINIVNLKHIGNVYRKNSSVLDQMISVLSSQELSVYLSQQVDSRSRELLPEPFLDHYIPVVTPAQGDCFYCSISLALFGDQKYFPIVRICILYEILENPNMYMNFLKSSLADINYLGFVLNNMASGTWADSSIMFVTSKILRRPIHSYDMDFGELGKIKDSNEFLSRMQNPSQGDSRHHKYLFDGMDAAKKPVCIHYRNMFDGGQKNHFVALLPKSDDSTVFPCIIDVFHDIRSIDL